MPSPFPGMNPYLEQKYEWQDFHLNFIARMEEALSKKVKPNYRVKSEVRLIIHERSAVERRFFGIADSGIVKTRSRKKLAVHTEAIASPVKLQLPAVEIEKHHYLEIRDVHNRRLVTVIEVLSPSNKTPGQDYDAYVSKRNEILQSQTHLVEIDLLRGGKRPASPVLPDSDYYVLVSRSQDRPSVDTWPFSVRDLLPVIPVPLSEPDPDISLDLKAVLDHTYDAVGFGDYIFSEAPEPPLSPADAEWARQFLPKRRRTK